MSVSSYGMLLYIDVRIQPATLNFDLSFQETICIETQTNTYGRLVNGFQSQSPAACGEALPIINGIFPGFTSTIGFFTRLLFTGFLLCSTLIDLPFSSTSGTQTRPLDGGSAPVHSQPAPDSPHSPSVLSPYAFPIGLQPAPLHDHHFGGPAAPGG